MHKTKSLLVTKTFLPPQNEYNSILQRAWSKEWITNRGELVLELEDNLINLLGVNNIIAMTNGTLPLQIAVKLFGKGGEVITTPFSYVATTSSIVWEDCTPVFVDIHPEYLTIDESKIEAAITSKTTAILATHVFGNPCHVEEIERIANKHNLRVIYDAAHCFGVTYKDQSIFNYGDISTCSFHATKLFHTGEGGAAFCNGQELYDKVFYHHNFGHNGPEAFHGIGINAKMSELQAAMGLAVFPYMDEIIENRRRIVEQYKNELRFDNFRQIKLREGTVWNNSYFPIIFESEILFMEALIKLNAQQIYPRRYFYPSLNTIHYLNGPVMPISEEVSQKIICLPLYVGLVEEEINLICNLLNSIE